MKTTFETPRDRSSIWFAVVAMLVLVGCVLFFIHRASAQKQTDGPGATQETAKGESATSGKSLGDAELRKRLTPIQYNVTKQSGTEPAFRNEYWNNHRAGIYVDVISGEPLFSSLDKFESGTGWPSFTKPIAKENVLEKTDRTFGIARNEVRSHKSDSHLGHLFDDGPPPSGMRYCMNSAALRFVPVEKLQEEGFGEYLALFEQKK